jgi:tRNA uridine 5-carboxymethylaminomethyl modification enzyme
MRRKNNKNKYDIIVIGGGHAGIEAAMVASRSLFSIAMITSSRHSIGRMSCNPAIGGSAKGQLVREIDAMGGVMGTIADLTAIHCRMLNLSKGPAVWGQRTQNDREWYSELAQNLMSDQKNLDIIEDEVVEIGVEDNVLSSDELKIKSITTRLGQTIFCNILIICAGTFLGGLLHTGNESMPGGRFGEKAINNLTENLNSYGIQNGRLKTGTPPRIDINSINFNDIELQNGDINPQPFSFRSDTVVNYQIPMFLTHTNEKTHTILRSGFSESPLFTGKIKGIGPRYCPSIEDKVERFKDRERHQIFIEPEGYNTNVVYVNGFSTSLPKEIQVKGLKSIIGLEKSRVLRYGYAIEYDFFSPSQLHLSLESKIIDGVFFAGQINGTSGYEEAAAQGLIAGINAVLKLNGKEPIILKRSEAYIGVLIDDLINKDTNEPYRMFTSNAEYRLLLRQDNADRRLMPTGYKIGLINKSTYDRLMKKEKLIKEGLEHFRSTNINENRLNTYLAEKGTGSVNQSMRVATVLQRPEGKINDLLMLGYFNHDPFIKNLNLLEDEKMVREVLEQIEIEIKYEGYILRQEADVKYFEKQESANIPIDFDYRKIKSLSSEGKQKLLKIKPRSIGQASRISGVTPADVSVLLVHLKV